MSRPALQRFGEWIARSPAGGSPDRVVERAADCVLDCIGAAAAGRGADSVAAMESLAVRQFAPGTSPIWFSGRGASGVPAALVNAMAATSLDVDDVHRKAAGHPGVSVVTAALAMAEAVGATGAETAAAIVVGYEAAVRVAMSRVAAHHPSTASGRWCGIGAAAAAARLRGLAPDRAGQAVLIAEHHAPRLLPAQLHGYAGSHAKEGIAWATMSGLAAVDLAEAGFRGYPGSLDDGLAYDPEALLAGLGESFAIEGLLFKPYACCRWAHPAMDAVRDILAARRIGVSDIEAIEVATFARAAGLGNSPAPAFAEEAQFSIPFLVAAMAIEGPEALLPLDEALVGRRDIEDLARKVKVSVDGRLDALFPAQTAARVTVATSGGRFEDSVDSPFGDPQNPMDRRALQAKFRTLTRAVLAPERAEAIIEACAALPAAGDTGDLLGLLGAP